MQAIGNYEDSKIRYPPGMENLNNTESYHGIYPSDVVRSSLWWDEVWRPKHKSDASGQTNDYEPDRGTYDPQGINSTGYLVDYGNVPGIFRLQVCRSWYGEAISDIKNKYHANAPCLCDSPIPAQKSRWSNPNNWTIAHTRTAVTDGRWHNFNLYGKMCLKHHDCHKGGSWKTLLNLTGDDKLAKHMKHAWTACEFKGHGEHKLGPQQISEPESTSSTADPLTSGIPPPDPPMATPHSGQPLCQARHEFSGNVTRSLKKRSDGGACERPQCIVDSVYRIVERTYGFNVNASTLANGAL
jgi:hypothetical protein